MSRLFSTGSRRWRLLRLEIFTSDGWRRVKCGKASRFELDHKIPVQRGGDRWDPKNLQTLWRSLRDELRS